MTIFIGMNSDTVRDAAATFILKTKEKHKIPQSVICNIIEDVTTLFQLCLSNITNLVKQHFDENNVDEKCQDLIMDVLSTDGANGNPFR